MIVATQSMIDDERWTEMGAFLCGESSLLVRDPIRVELADEWRHVADLEARLEDALLIGLVGGTGVGKSTLINALAAAEISRSSDRRPTTDRVVVYLHRDADIPAEIPTANLSVPYVVHRRQALLKVILLDFPDFDSADVSHAEILRRFLPHLDVLLVVVDDMKYGDRKLYDLLATLEIDPINLFLVLNKLDRLLDRYGDRAPMVSREILADLRQNAQKYADLVVPPAQEFAISAAVAFAARDRQEGSEDRVMELPEAAGDFNQLLRLIESYQLAKRRRLAKAKNIDVRKTHLAELLAKEGLSAGNRRMLAELEQIVTSAESELAAILQTIPSTLFSDRDRRHWRQPRLRAAAEQWGIPLSLVVTLFAEMARWRGGSKDTRFHYRARIERHYRSYLDAAKNLQRRFDAELWGMPPGEDAVRAVTATSTDADVAWTASLGQATSIVSADNPVRPKTHNWLGHIPALVVAGAMLTGKLLATSPQDEDVGLMRWLWNGLSVLNPWFLLNLGLAMIFVYLATGAVIWLRELQRLDRDMAQAEQQIRAAVSQRGRVEVNSVQQRLSGLSQEFDLLQRLTEK